MRMSRTYCCQLTIEHVSTIRSKINLEPHLLQCILFHQTLRDDKMLCIGRTARRVPLRLVARLEEVDVDGISA